MKKFLLILGLGAMTFSCTKAQKGYLINGSGEKLTDGQQIILKRSIGGRNFEGIDTVNVENGTFKFSGEVKNPEVLYLNSGEKSDYKVFVENSTIQISILDSENLKVNGSKAQVDYEAYKEVAKPFNQKQKELYKEYLKAHEDGNKEKIATINKLYDENTKAKNQAIISFIENNPKSAASPQIIREALFYSLKLSELDKVFSKLDASVKAFPVSQKIEKHIKTLKSVAIGQKAPDFSQYTPNGERVSLSSIKGKVILVDFWASWCGPCRRANPHVVELYNKYHEQGLEILGVSLDKDKEAWVKAIEKDQLPWTQISDLKGWGNAAAKLYGVNSIPHVMLLDSEGKIIAKQLHGEELENKIKETLNK